MIKAIRPSLAGVGVKQYQEFTASGTFNVPSTVNLVYITACGEGSSRNTSIGGDIAGSNTTFGSYLTLYGGVTATFASVGYYPKESLTTVNFGASSWNKTNDENYHPAMFDTTRRIMVYPSVRGRAYLANSGDTSVNTVVTNPKTPLSPYGDALGTGSNGTGNGAACSAETVIREPIAVMPGEAITVTIGNGSSLGGAGYLLVEWFE